MIASRPSNHPLGRQKSHSGPQCMPELQGTQKTQAHSMHRRQCHTNPPIQHTATRMWSKIYTNPTSSRAHGCLCGFHRNTMQLHGSICGHGPKTSRKPACVNKYVKGAWVWWTCPEAYQRKEPCLEHRRTADSRKDLSR